MKKPVKKAKGGAALKGLVGGALGAALSGDIKGAIPGILGGVVADKMARKSAASAAPADGASAAPATAAQAAPPPMPARRAKSAAPLMRQGMKSGGKVMKKASGGKMGGRGDGCCIRGKTKGTMR